MKLQVVLLGLFCLSLASAQETRGVILGRVTDPQSAAVAGAAISVTNIDNNTVVNLTTNDTGYYEANFLLPGNYRLTAGMTGFKKSVRSGIEVSLNARVEIDIRLELGESAETLSVTAEAPLIDASSVSSGRVMENRDVMDLPTFNNSPLMLIKLAPGMEASNNRRYNGVNGLGGTAEAHNIGAVGGNDWSIDGVPDMGNGYTAAYLPYSTTIQEYKVATQDFDASVGHTSGASISIMTKSGGNDFHGDATWEFWQQRWNGTRFFIKQAYFRAIDAAEASGNHALAQQLRASPEQPSGHDNDYGAAIGGPVILPKIFNGKNKLFFFFSFDGFDDRKTTESTFNHTLPTSQERQGNFSDLLSISATKYQIYDPLSVRPDPSRPGHYIRDPIPLDILPQSRIVNPVYPTYLKFLPSPNNPPASSALEPLNNYLDPAEPYNWFYEAFANRYDYAPSEKHRFFGRWSWLKYRENRQDWTYAVDPGLMTNGVNRNNLGTMADYVYTPSASTVFDVEAGANFNQEGNILTPTALNFTPSSVGLPAYMDAKAGVHHALPIMSFAGYDTLGQSVPAWTHYEIISLKGNVLHIHGKHTFRSGIDVRDHRRLGGDPGVTSGSFAFNNAFTSAADDTTTAGSLGHSWAAFMMGLPSSSSVDTNATYATSNPYLGWFGQDNWRVTPKLTLNLGMRMEYEFGIKERYNRLIAGFDPAASLPITAIAQAAYAKNPIPELAATAFAVMGGSLYAGPNGVGARFPAGQLMWLPRIGAAYQLTSRTVIRGGYGIYQDTLNAQTQSPDLSGFSRTTTDPTSNDFGQTWLSGDPRNGISPLTNPFPIRSDGTRFDAPVGNALGLLAKDGNGWTFIDPNFQRAREQRWRVDVQHQFGGNMMISVAYAGMHAGDIRITKRLDALPAQYWATGTTRNDAVATNLNQNVTNPFYIANFASLQSSNPVLYQALASRSFFTSPTIRKSQLLRPFPQMNGLYESGGYGESKAHSVEAVFQRRFGHGFTINANYTGLYERDRDYYKNEFDSAPSWEESNNGTPWRFAATGIYELPFGKGKWFARTGIWNAAFGGWQIAAAFEVQPGPLLNWGNLFYTGNLSDICSGPQTLDRWFNTSGFVTNPALQPNSFQTRVFPTRVSGCRADGLNRLDSNIQRTFKITDRMNFQLRMDALNALNESQFDVPNMDPTSTNFGKITNNTSSTMRFLLIQGRIRF
jgi:Carboxypeptidase regulatory-like domain